MALLLEYLKVLLAAAPVAGVVAIVFMVLFRQPLKNLIGRTSVVKFPGGEWATTQVERTAEVEALPEPPEPESPSPEVATPPPGLTLSPEDQERLTDFLKAERARAFYWEYRYLNLYLVHNTQRVLDWIANTRPTLHLYDAMWSGLIPEPGERKAILDALLSHHLVQVRGELLEVTPKGQEYKDFRGQLLGAVSTEAEAST